MPFGGAGGFADARRAGRAEVEQIFEDPLAQLRVRPAGGAAADREHALDAVVAQALAQDTLPHHARRAEEDHLHACSMRYGKP